jgi:hypothetical protein
MSVQVEALREGKEYQFIEGNRKIAKIIDLAEDAMVVYEYHDEDGNLKLKQCTASEFAEQAQRNYRDDPEYEGIYPYVFVAQSKPPEEAAKVLNMRMNFKGRVVPLKTAIREMVDKGYRPAKRGEIPGLEYGEKFVPVRRLTEEGFEFAQYLCREKD